MKNSKILFFLCMVVIGTILVVGCGKNQSNKSSDIVTISIIRYADNSNTGEVLDWKDTVAGFKALYPNVNLEVESLFGESYHQKATARVESGDIPDVALMWPGQRTGYFKAVQTDIRPYINMDEYLPSVMTPQGPNGEIYMLPTGFTNASVLYVNTAILDKYGFEIPKTYEDMKAMVEPLKADGLDVIAMANKDGWVMPSCLLGNLIGRYTGERDFLVKAVAGERSFEDDGFIQALKMVETMYNDGVLPSTSIQTDYGTSAANFLNGRAAFMIDGAWRTVIFVDDETGEDLPIADFIELSTFPAVPGEKSNMKGSSAGEPRNGFGITKAALRDPAITEAAVNFMIYTGGEEESLRRFQRSGQLPGYKMELPMGTSNMIKKQESLRNSVTSYSNGVDNILPSVPNSKLNENLQKLALGRITPEEIAAQLERDIRDMNK